MPRGAEFFGRGGMVDFELRLTNSAPELGSLPLTYSASDNDSLVLRHAKTIIPGVGGRGLGSQAAANAAH